MHTGGSSPFNKKEWSSDEIMAIVQLGYYSLFFSVCPRTNNTLF